MINVITSKDNKKVKYALSLKENKFRKENRQFLAETFKSLEMAIKANMVIATFSTEWLDIPDTIEQNIVSEELLKKLSNNVNPEGVVFIAKFREPKQTSGNKILFLDHIADPGNMGTLIRTALAFDYDEVVISQDSVSVYNEKVVNSSKGAIFAIDTKIGDIKDYKGTHKIIVSTLAEDSIDLNDVDVPEKFVLVLGNESHGVKREVNRSADVRVKIAISNIDSLNVAVAGGILMNKIH